MRDTVVKMVNVAQKKLQPKKKDKWLLELLDGCIKYIKPNILHRIKIKENWKE